MSPRIFAGKLAGDLESVDKASGSGGVKMARAESADDIGDSFQNRAAVLEARQSNGTLFRFGLFEALADFAVKVVVKEAIGHLAERRRFAAGAVGFDMTT